MIPLQMLPSGHTARIGQLMGNPHEVHRLHELGLREGLPVEMIQTGNPCIVRVQGQKLCFRDDEFLRILVLDEE